MATGAVQAGVTSGTGERAGGGAWLRRFAWAVVVYNVLVIVWGAVVRATGSGAGCGDHWPLCNGQVVPLNPRVATVIEFTHRMMSGGTLVLIVALVVWVFRGTVERHLARTFAVAGLLLTLNEALLGALLVKLGLTATSTSPLRPPMLALHLSNTLLLLGALALTAHFLGRRAAVVRGAVRFEHRFPAVTGTGGRDGDRGDGIAGGAGGHALPFYFAPECAGGGLLFVRGVVGAAADPASGECGRRGGFHSVAAVARGVCCPRRGASGRKQPRAWALAGRVAGVSVSAGWARCSAARAGVDAGVAPGGSGCFLVCAGGVNRHGDGDCYGTTPPIWAQRTGLVESRPPGWRSSDFCGFRTTQDGHRLSGVTLLPPPPPPGTGGILVSPCGSEG